MASRTGSRFGRRITWLAVAIVLAVGGYIAGWFYMARALETRIATTLTELNGGGVRAFCEEPEARGFPFRIGLFCKSVFYENMRDGVSVRAGALRSAANVYQPFRVLSELEGPAGIMLPFTVPLEARWESLRASGRLARPLPERVSVEGRTIELLDEEGSADPLATLGAMQIHARRQQQDLELAVSFANLALGDEVVPDVPPLEGRARVTVADGVALLEERVRSLNGRSAKIEEMVVGVVGARAGLTVSGPVSIADDGRIDAELSVSIDDPASVARIMAEIFPDERSTIMTAANAIGGLGNAPIQVRVVRGRVFVGFIPVGTIPPI
jgi:hypothetical protein